MESGPIKNPKSRSGQKDKAKNNYPLQKRTESHCKPVSFSVEGKGQNASKIGKALNSLLLSKNNLTPGEFLEVLLNVKQYLICLVSALDTLEVQMDFCSQAIEMTIPFALSFVHSAPSKQGEFHKLNAQEGKVIQSVLKKMEANGVDTLCLKKLPTGLTYVRIGGFFEVALSPLLADLLMILAEESPLKDKDDPLVGWKRFSEIKKRLYPERHRKVKNHRVSHAIYLLRQALWPLGNLVVFNKRYKGYRFALRSKVKL